MRASFPIAAALALTGLAIGQPFTLSRVANSPVVNSATVSIQVLTIDDPPAEPILTDPNLWTIFIKGSGLKLSLKPASAITYDPQTGLITLALPLSVFGGVDPAKGNWSVSFQNPGGGLLSARQDPVTNDAFALGVPSKPKITGPDLTIELKVSGIPPPGNIVNNRNNWRVLATDSNGNAKAVQPVTSATYRKNSQFVMVNFPAAQVAPVDLSSASYTVGFLAPDSMLTSAPTGSSSGALAAAKGRDDADLYFAGTYIAGVGTKPLWQIDAKGGYSNSPDKFPVVNWFVGKSKPTIRFGIYGEMKTNLDAQTPIDRTQLDPDSLSAYTTLFRSGKIDTSAYKWEIQPAGGEFSRKYPASNFISGGRFRLIRVLAAKKAWGADLIPSLGFEGGKNLNKPGMLFNRPVDLHSYDGIVRLRGGADANFYVNRRAPSSPSDAYVFVLSGSWVARVPFMVEPFTTYAYLPDPQDPTQITRQQTIAMRSNTRHYVQVDATWNITKLLGIQAEYKYGSLPPMFEFTSHQMSVGLVFKAAYNHNNGVSSPLP
jgi:hypothetical protein